MVSSLSRINRMPVSKAEVFPVTGVQPTPLLSILDLRLRGNYDQARVVGNYLRPSQGSGATEESSSFVLPHSSINPKEAAVWVCCVVSGWFIFI